MVEHKELKKANGDVFFEVRRTTDNSFISMNWVGIQSLETIVMGCNQVLTMLREKPCPRLLNSNRELIGPWEVAVNWLAYKWAPQAKSLGLRYYAHVLSPGIYGQRSFQSLYPALQSQLNIEVFEDEKKAEQWLLLNVA
ncbi:hypothetical protein SAMN04487941_1641 [Pontibacter akesuensis]|uniref:SpoIIAA-like n=1 Tax=Pontibacter akesuensis TaxID=388950 RepID=A0A1I7HSB5_9BACT|nr:hypothetical protein GCM10007389_14820 [Pontibacter akesuensis]SFU63624.1 hypothetical protein SAMN04487941_1641 [Pontibacter akesuensis]